MKSIYSFSYEQLINEMISAGYKKYNADQIFKWLYRKRVTSFDEMTDLSKEMKEVLNAEFEFPTITMLSRQISKDGTRKYLFGLADGSSVETVLMVYNYGKSVCFFLRSLNPCSNGMGLGRSK